MGRRPPVDHQLRLGQIPVIFKDGSRSNARSEGNNAGWICKCGDGLPLIGRCYFQFGDTCYTVCPTCSKKYRVNGDPRKRANEVVEL